MVSTHFPASLHNARKNQKKFFFFIVNPMTTPRENMIKASSRRQEKAEDLKKKKIYSAESRIAPVFGTLAANLLGICRAGKDETCVVVLCTSMPCHDIIIIIIKLPCQCRHVFVPLFWTSLRFLPLPPLAWPFPLVPFLPGPQAKTTARVSRIPFVGTKSPLSYTVLCTQLYTVLVLLS